MVRFAPRPAPFLVLRETISPAQEYGLALASAASRHSPHSEGVESRLACAPGTGADQPSSNPAADPVPDPMSGPAVDPTPDLVLDPAADPVSNPAVDPKPDPVLGPVLDPVLDPVSDPTPDRNSPATSAPDPFTDADALEELEAEITTLAAHIHAATHRLLTLIAEFDRRRGWELGGHRTCAHWLSFRTGIDLGAAREKVRAARALEDLPETSASMARGELSFSKVRALTRVATPGNEGDLVALARGCTAAQLERMLRAFGRGSREDEAEADRRRHASRTFSVFPDDDGMYLVRGRLPAEIGALLMRAVEAASDALFRKEWAGIGSGAGEREVSAVGGSGENPPGGASGKAPPAGGRWGGSPGGVSAETPRPRVDSEKRAAQRRADALGLLAERALAAGFGDGPVSGTRAARYQVVLHVEAETLRVGEGSGLGRCGVEGGRTVGRSNLEDGTRVSAETSRRISCDAGLLRVTRGPSTVGRDQPGLGRGTAGPEWVGSASQSRGRLGSPPAGTGAVGPAPVGPALVSHAPIGPSPAGHAPVGPSPQGSILHVGRRTRTIPPALRRALEIRDRGCRFPGCGSRFTDAHHVKHWADGGETSLENTLLLCRHHHRLVHEEGWTVDWWGRGRTVFFDPRGGNHFEGRWEPPAAKREADRKEGDARGGRREPSAGGSGAPGLPKGRGHSQANARGVIDDLKGGGRQPANDRGVVDEPTGRGQPPISGRGGTDVSPETPTGGPRSPWTDHTPLLEGFLEGNRRRGVVPDPWTSSAQWKTEADIPDQVCFRAMEAAEARET